MLKRAMVSRYPHSPVLADQETAVFTVYRQHPLAAAGAFGVCQIIMAELSFGRADFLDQFLRVGFNIPDEGLLLAFPFGDIGKLHLPTGGKLRFFRSSGTRERSCFPLEVRRISWPFFSIRKEWNSFSMISARVATVPRPPVSVRALRSLESWIPYIAADFPWRLTE